MARGHNIIRRGIDLLLRPERMEAALWRNYTERPSPDISQRLFDHYQPLAQKLASRHFHRRKAGTCELVDVEQLAYEGLLQSIRRFNPERGIPFSAFCRRRILGNISTGLEKATEQSAQYGHRRKVERERLNSLRGHPYESNDPVEALSKLTALLAIGLMIEDGTPTDPDELASDEPNAYESLVWREMQQNLDTTIGKLDERSGYVITQHYVNGLSFKQIAEVIGVTRGRISQIHRAALLRLRELMSRYK